MTVLRFQLSCYASSELHVRFEPLGPEYLITAKDHLDVELDAADDRDAELEMMYGERHVTVWYRPGVRAKATNKAGEELDFPL